jgi:hypothetical protein
MPSLRGRPASVMSATLQRPLASASAACIRCASGEQPPVSVASMTRGRMFR